MLCASFLTAEFDKIAMSQFGSKKPFSSAKALY